MTAPHDLVPPRAWDDGYEQIMPDYRPDRVLFRDVFSKYCPRGASCCELGCYPGNQLMFLAAELNAEISGVDQTEHLERLVRYCRSRDFRIGRIDQGDFFSWSPATLFDFVFSNGLIEHFRNFDEAIARHVALTRPGGHVLISVPHFRRLQYVAHLLCDRRNLALHHMPAMDPCAIAEAIQRAGATVLEARFASTCEFWIDPAKSGPLPAFVGDMLARLSRVIDSAISWPNRWTSPYVVVVGRRNEA